MSINLNSRFDVFISYARIDNQPLGDSPETSVSVGWVEAIRDELIDDHSRFSTERFTIFLDTKDIRDMDDWRHRILGALRSSKILLVCLSPNWSQSEYCLWEWEDYLRRQVHQLAGSDSVAVVMFAPIDESSDVAESKSLQQILRKNYTDIHRWFPLGPASLKHGELRNLMANLGESLWERIKRSRHAEKMPGNLRRLNPHFVGRTAELTRIHESLGVGTIGVVTVLYGLGGQGKTELAIAYAHLYADELRAGCWVLRAEGKTEILTLIGELAFLPEFKFNPTEEQKLEPELLGRAVLLELERRVAEYRSTDCNDHTSVLLVIDNVSVPELLSPKQLDLLPRSEWLRIMATTRLDLKSSRQSLTVLPIDSLRLDEALALVREHQPIRKAEGASVGDPSMGVPAFASTSEETAALKVVRELNGFTLAVEQVAIFAGMHSETSFQGLLASLRDHGIERTDLLAEAIQLEGTGEQIRHQQQQLGLILDETLHMLATRDSSLVSTKVRDIDSLLSASPSISALQFAASFPPDSVPWPWLQKLTTEKHPELSQVDPFKPNPWLSIRRRLEGMRLLTSDDDVGRMHRLIAAHVITRRRDDSIENKVRTFIQTRADEIESSLASPPSWELDAMEATLSKYLGRPNLPLSDESADLANAALKIAEKLQSYRSLQPALGLASLVKPLVAKLVESDPRNKQWKLALSRSIELLGDLALVRGRNHEARRLFDESNSVAERLVKSDSDSIECRERLAISLSRLGTLTSNFGKSTEAKEFLEKSFENWTWLLEHVDVPYPEHRRNQVVVLMNLGKIAKNRGEFTEANRHFNRHRDVIQQLLVDFPENIEWQRDLCIAWVNLGDLAMEEGRTSDAKQCFDESRRVILRLQESEPEYMMLNLDLSLIMVRLANLELGQGRLHEARQILFDIVSIRRGLVSKDSDNPRWSWFLSLALREMGNFEKTAGYLPSARVFLEESMAIRRQLLENDPRNALWNDELASIERDLRDLSVKEGEPDRLVAEANSIYQQLEVNPDDIDLLQRLASLLEKLGDLES